MAVSFRFSTYDGGNSPRWSCGIDGSRSDYIRYGRRASKFFERGGNGTPGLGNTIFDTGIGPTTRQMCNFSIQFDSVPSIYWPNECLKISATTFNGFNSTPEKYYQPALPSFSKESLFEAIFQQNCSLIYSFISGFGT